MARHKITREKLTLAELKRRCAAHEISQRALADASGVHQPNISAMFSKRRTPKPETLAALVKAYYDICRERKVVDP